MCILPAESKSLPNILSLNNLSPIIICCSLYPKNKSILLKRGISQIHPSKLLSHQLIWCFIGHPVHIRFSDHFFSSLSPDKRFWIAILCFDITMARLDQLKNTFEHTSSNLFFSDLTKKPFYHVQQ